MKFGFFVVLLFMLHAGFAQKPFRGIVADSLTKKALPFATIMQDNRQNAVITGIDGHFSLSLLPSTTHIIISYVGYRTRSIAVNELVNGDTIWLSRAAGSLIVVTILPQTEKIRRIINTAIRNKPLHNPELYEKYQCYIYYKMYADLVPVEIARSDSNAQKLNPALPAVKFSPPSKTDSSFRALMANSHAVFSETYSRRLYKKPKQVQEEVLASRFSGLRKTYFTSLVTNVLPFHVYDDYIKLNGTDYINPVARGWRQRYDFRLEDELITGADTVFILSFRPKKNAVFNSLKGMVFINSDGYAISHFISSTGDSVSDREARIEQIYTRVGEKWFPKELNYDLLFRKYPTPQTGIKLNGHSVIDSVSFGSAGNEHFDKAHSVTLGDSVDLHSEHDWQRMRPEPITTREVNTYRIIDSVSEKIKLEGIVQATGKLAVGKVGVGMFDIAANRLFAYNKYQGIRAGLGLYTNERASKYYSVGGWGAYGFSDGRWKYGLSATLFPGGDKDNSLYVSYQDNYQSAGDVHINPEIDRQGFRNWLLVEVDRIKEFAIGGHTQRGYWQLELSGMQQDLQSRYDNNFEVEGKNIQSYRVREAGFGLRYAYGEKRVPLFGYYVPYSITQYPVFYFKMQAGNISSGSYSSDYGRVVAAIAYIKHFNRWGNDRFQLEAGIIHSFNDQPFSRSFLLAGKGFRNDQFNYYAWGGFLTMHPYDYFNDRFVSFMYKHDFDKFLWQWKYSKPFISVAHNLVYGALSSANISANAGISATATGYHETGILINQLFQINYLHLANIYLNTGPFYHWSGPVNFKTNAVWVVGISAGF